MIVALHTPMVTAHVVQAIVGLQCEAIVPSVMGTPNQVMNPTLRAMYIDSSWVMGRIASMTAWWISGRMRSAAHIQTGKRLRNASATPESPSTRIVKGSTEP